MESFDIVRQRNLKEKVAGLEAIAHTALQVQQDESAYLILGSEDYLVARQELQLHYSSTPLVTAARYELAVRENDQHYAPVDECIHQVNLTLRQKDVPTFERLCEAYIAFATGTQTRQEVLDNLRTAAHTVFWGTPGSEKIFSQFYGERN